MRNYIYNAINESTATVSEDYPWGYKLRTKQRYWVEDSKRKDGGQRFVYQTLNPKTDRWCKPKKSTYDAVCIIFRDENNHVKHEGLSIGYSNEESALKFIERHKDNLTEFQWQQLRTIIAVDKVMSKVKFTITPSKIGPVDLFSQKPEDVAKREAMLRESKERKLEEQESMRNINMHINHEMRVMKREGIKLCGKE